jgi:hypothetical protein
MSTLPVTEGALKGGTIPPRMKKDTRLTFRVHSNLKKDLESIADREGRSVAQICDAFLKAGSEAYRKNGPKYLQRFFSRREKKNLSD